MGKELAGGEVNLTSTDQRPRLFEPPPVRLVTVADAHLPAWAGSERELDAFYIGILGFERDAEAQFPVYRAQNFRICFDVVEPPIAREDMRALGIEVLSLSQVEANLIDEEIEYLREKGMTTGSLHLLLLDPSGNWIALTEARIIA